MPSNDSFIFYRSFFDSISLAPDDDQLELFRHLSAVCLGDTDVDDVPYPYNMLINQCLYSVETAKQRYEKAVEDGTKGGRPKKWIDRDEAERLFAEFGNWNAVADKLEVSCKTLQRARYVWYGKSGQNGQNLNVNDNVNDNVNENDNVNVNSQLTNKLKKAAECGLIAHSTAKKENGGVVYRKVKNADGDWVMVPVKGGDES